MLFNLLANNYGTIGDGVLGLLKGFFGYPAILVGLFAMVGSIVQKRKGGEILISTLKTVIGFLIISGGASVLSTTLGNLTNVIKNGFGIGQKGSSMEFIIPSNEAAMAWMQKTVPDLFTTASLIMILGMVGNIILAKFSNLKFIYLTGHVIFYTSLVLSLSMYMAGLRPLENTQDTAICLLSGMCFLGLYMVISPALSAKYAAQIIGNDKLALGHTGGFGCALSGIMGEGILKASKKSEITSTENIKIPKKLKILADNTVALSVTMLIIYMTIMMLGLGLKGLDAFVVDGKSMLGSDKISNSSGGAIAFAFVQSLTFVSGIMICIFGVKMFLEELIPSFSGIATKLIRGSRAAVEVQAFWPYAQDGVVIGFLSSFIGGLLAFGVMLGTHFSVNPELKKYFPVVIPELFPHLFIGGTGAVFGNIKGGYIGAIVGPFIIGFIWAFFPVIYCDLGCIPAAVNNINGQQLNGTCFAEVDHIIGIIPYLGVKYLTGWGFTGLAFGMFCSPIVISQIKNATKRNKKSKVTLNDIKNQQLEEEKIKDVESVN
ncbi:PTS ascorbate transporter subunit IIC [Spiroplasma endosymbiont of Aspidapion aeneum]|uniref:PTS ascorbate transporter subunit IIC n=1 Tax=Spiroplasma endosymbiont of Aspidapion aeneum TaxID=3066276 RepID=UPI00313C9F86